jgi:WD40 repeat protein
LQLTLSELFYCLTDFSNVLLQIFPLQPGDARLEKLAVISGSFDETIKFWDIATQTCWQTLKLPHLYEGMKIEDIQGLTEAQWATLQALGAI